MKKQLLFTLLAGLLFTFSCSTKEESGTLIIRLTDSPGDYESVFIDLRAVEVHASTGNQESGWTTLETNAGVYDLLELTNGVESVIANDTYPSGRISQLRLLLGENNSVVIDGETYPLTVPSGSQSGLKLQINEDLAEGITYSILLDFDAAKSVVSAGASNRYILKPVIKTITEAQDGAVKGTVIPMDLGVAVYAISGEDTISTSYAVEGNSDFFLGGLADGSYTISFDPGDLSDFTGKVVENVSVTVGEVTDLGETELVQ